jgi:ABC-type multidrug transport system ATPase subunit
MLKREAVNQGITIVSTIHSPSSSAFFEFDRLILMNEGSILYQGKMKVIVPYLTSIDICVPSFKNPADFLLTMTQDP